MERPPGSPVPVRAARPAGPPRCLDCFYVLSGLGPGECPECGRPFDPAKPATFTTKPPFVRWKLWLPGLLLAAAGGVGLYAVLLGAGLPVGWGLTIVLPLGLGAVLGYRCRVGPFFVTLLGLALAVLVISPLVAMHVMGLLCGVIGIVVIGGPLAVGALLGWSLRLWLRRSGYAQAAWLPVLVLLALPVFVIAAEALAAPARRPVAISTSRVLDASPARVWAGLLFYDDLRGDAPLLFRLGMPMPRATHGSLDAVGARQTCVFDKGFVCKRLTRRTAPRRLAFDVIDQSIGFERSLRLRRGTFLLEPQAAGARTKLTLVTGYDARLRPRFAWYPAERHAVRTLHRWILDGVAAEVEGAGALARFPGDPERQR